MLLVRVIGRHAFNHQMLEFLQALCCGLIARSLGLHPILRSRDNGLLLLHRYLKVQTHQNDGALTTLVGNEERPSDALPQQMASIRSTLGALCLEAVENLTRCLNA